MGEGITSTSCLSPMTAGEAEQISAPKKVTIRQIENGYLMIDETPGIILHNKQTYAKDIDEMAVLLQKFFQTGAE